MARQLNIDDSNLLLLTQAFNSLCAVMIFMTLPALLPLDDYSFVIRVATLMSFLTLAEIGLTNFLGKELPLLYSKINKYSFKTYFYSGLVILIVLTTIFSLFIFNYILVRSDGDYHFFVLYLLPPTTTVFTFSALYYTTRGNFRLFAKRSMQFNMIKLLSIPGIFIFGKYCIAYPTVLAGLFILVIDAKLYIVDKPRIDFYLLIPHLFESIILSASAFLWSQLLNFTRLISTIFYGDSVIASYGFLNSLFNLGTGLIIAYLAPVTIYVYKTFKVSPLKALDYFGKFMTRSLLLCGFSFILAYFTLSPALNFFYDNIIFEDKVIKHFLINILIVPPFLIWGSVFIASGEVLKWMGLLFFVLVGGLITVTNYQPYFLDRAFGLQFVMLSFISMVSPFFFFFQFPDENIFRVLIKPILIFATYLVISFAMVFT